MTLRELPIIPKGRCSGALGTTPDHIDKLEGLGVIEFTETPTGRKYASFRSLESAAEWLWSRPAA